MDSALKALTSVNVFSDQMAVTKISGNKDDGFIGIKHFKGYINDLFQKVGAIFKEALTAIGSSNLLDKTLDRTLSVIDATRIFGDIDYVVSGKFFADISARDVLEVIKRIAFTGVDILSTLLFLESASVISLAGIASAIGKIPLIGSALVEFGAGSFIQINLIVGGIIQAVQDVSTFQKGEISSTALTFKLISNVAEVATRVYLVIVGYHLFIPILTIISKAIGCFFEYQDRINDKELNKDAKTIDPPKITVLSVIQKISRIIARAFNSLDLNNKMAKLGIVVFAVVPKLSGLVAPLKGLKATIDFVNVFKTVGELSSALKKKVLEQVKAIIGLVAAILESISFLASHSLLGLGRISGAVGFNVLGLAGRLSLVAVKNTFMIAFLSIDVYQSGYDLVYNDKNSKVDIFLKCLNATLKIGAITLAGGALLFAGFATTTAFFALSVSGCVLDLVLAFKDKVIKEEFVNVS